MMGTEADPPIQEQADRWFARLLAPDCDAHEREAFERWRQTPGHARAYAERERVWRRLGAPDAAAAPRLQALRRRVLSRTAAAPDGGGSAEAAGQDWRQALSALPPRSRPAPARHRRRRWPAAVAAAMCGVAILFGLRFVPGTPPETVHAAADAVRAIDLDDGTRVQLDVGSELAVRYDRRERAVALRRGRAVFEVTQEAARPFTVDLGDSRLTVLGTRFQAAREAARVSVILDSGALRLDGAEASGGRSERLRPGDEISYATADPSTWRLRGIDSEAATAWTRGRLVFRATPLAEAVDEVNRYAQPRLRLHDPSLAGLEVSGNFIAGDSALVAETWAATLPLRVERSGEEIVLHVR